MLDEGHVIGASLSMTDRLQMCCTLSSHARWVMTGTPTPRKQGSQLVHLQPLLKFLHDPFYENVGAWNDGILKVNYSIKKIDS